MLAWLGAYPMIPGESHPEPHSELVPGQPSPQRDYVSNPTNEPAYNKRKK